VAYGPLGIIIEMYLIHNDEFHRFMLLSDKQKGIMDFLRFAIQPGPEHYLRNIICFGTPDEDKGKS
jgi:hypothetical protein